MTFASISLPILNTGESSAALAYESPFIGRRHPEPFTRRVEVTLIVPPVWELSFQSLGIPALVAWTRRAGYEVEAKEYNIGFHQFLSGSKLISSEKIACEYKEILNSDYYRNNYELRRDDEFIRIDLSFGHCHLVCNNYSRVKEFLDDERVNTHLRYYRTCGIDKELGTPIPDRVRLIGITVEGENQVVAALTLARLIKKVSPDNLIVLGGSWVTAMKSIIKDEGELLSDIDFLIPNKGEVPFDNLLAAIAVRRGKPVEAIAGVMTRMGARFSEAPTINYKLKADLLPAPELFDLINYRRPTVVPYESERGCYWGQCKFCHHIQHYTHSYNSKSIEKVIEELREYQKKFDFNVVAFVDAAMPPRRVREIAENFLKENINLRWAGFSRIEKQFTPELFDIASKSGLDVISFGVETAGGRLAEFIGKSLDPEITYHVLKACSDAGIYTTSGIMNGLPSESMEELQDLWTFLDRIKSFTYLHPHLFKFERGSEFYENAQMYNLEIIPNHDECRLSAYAEYVDHNGPTSRGYIKATDANKRWWTENMGRTLDWKSQGDKFCKAVQVIVDT